MVLDIYILRIYTLTYGQTIPVAYSANASYLRKLRRYNSNMMPTGGNTNSPINAAMDRMTVWMSLTSRSMMRNVVTTNMGDKAYRLNTC